jgi:glycosyltransferase involved in cell wall biosynthesis
MLGTYDPGFPRAALLAEGLRRRDYAPISCPQEVWGPTEQRMETARRGLANPILLRRLFGAYARLARRLHGMKPAPDALLIPYPGQLDAVVLRLMRPRAHIILDAFVSIDETLEDRGIGRASDPSRLAGRAIDRLAFRCADRVIVDTAAHARRFAARYGLDLARALVVPVGAFDPGALPALSLADRSQPLRVLYFGGFIPLHGVDVILDAAARLGPAAGVELTLIGEGQEADAVQARVAAMAAPHVHLLRTWLPQAELIQRHIAGADVCLGIFADRPKAQDVVPAKAYLTLACARALVTADSPAVREELMARAEAGQVPVVTSRAGDGASLAAALAVLRDNPDARMRTASAGRRLYEQHFSPQRIVQPLCDLLDSLSAPR